MYSLPYRVGISVGLVVEVYWQCLVGDTGFHKLSDRWIQHQPDVCSHLSH